MSKKLLTLLLTLLLTVNSTITLHIEAEESNEEPTQEEPNTQEVMEEENNVGDVEDKEIVENQSVNIKEDDEGHLIQEGISEDYIQSLSDTKIKKSGSCGTNVNYVLYDNGLLVISGTGDMTSSLWEMDMPDVKKVIIQEGVTSIGASAFAWYDNITSISIPSSVTSIGVYVVSECDALESIVISPDNPVYDSRDNCNAIIKTSNNTLVFGCNNTTIPNTVTTIGDSAFSKFSSLTSISIPDSVTTIGDSAFSLCHSLTSINIGNSVTTIGDDAFGYCDSLASISIPDSVTTIGDGAFYRCSSITSISIPDSVTTIGQLAFAFCSSSTSANIGNSVTIIGDSAFCDCSSLTSITIPNSVTTIGNSAFLGCDSLTSVNIGNSVTTIGNYAFSNCPLLTSISIPDSVITIGAYAFSSCSSLTSVNIGNSVETINMYAFRACISLTSIFIPISVKTMKSSPFELCNKSLIIYVEALYMPWNWYSDFDKQSSDGSKFQVVWGSEPLINESKVIFHSNYDTDKTIRKYFNDGSYTIESDIFNRNDYILSSWNTKTNGTGKRYNVGQTINDNGQILTIDLYAQWRKVVESSEHQENYSFNTDSYYSNTNHKLFNIIEKGKSVSNGFKIKINDDIYQSDMERGTLADTIEVKCDSDDNATIYKDGFYTFTIPYYLIGDNNYVVMYQDNIKNPFVQTLLIDKSVENQRSFNNVLVNDETLYVASMENKNINELIKIYPIVNWNNHGEGKVWLEQDGNKIDLTNNLTNTLILSKCGFKANKTVYLCAKAADGTQIKEKTKIHVYKQNINAIDFSLGDNYELDISDSSAGILKLLTSDELKLTFKGIENIPISYTVKNDGSVVGTIGIEAVKEEDKVAAYKATKNMVDSMKKESNFVYSKETSEKLKELKMFGEPMSSISEIGVKGDIQVIGYLKGKLNDNGVPYFNNVELLVTFEAGVNYTFNTTIAAVPAYFKTEFKTKLNNLLSCVYNGDNQEILPSPKDDMDLTLSISAEAGPGWEGYLSGGVKGTGNVKLHSELPQKDNNNRWSVYGNFAFVGSLAGINGEWSIVKTNEMIFRENGQWCWKELNDNALTFVPNRNRSILKVDNINDSIFTGISGYCAPSIINLPDDKLLAVWISDVETRKLVDKNGLFYSIYDGEQWSSPVLVYDDGTNDSVPQLQNENGTIYLVWQNYDNVFDTDDFPEYEIISKQNKTVYSIFNIEDNSWAIPEQYDDNWYLCESIIPDDFDKDVSNSTTPIKVLNDNGLKVILYTSLDEEGNNQIYGIVNDGFNWGNPISLTDSNESINNYSATINNNGNIALLYTSGDPSDSSLFFKDDYIKHNLILNDVDYVEETLVPNNELSLRLGIENEGIETVNGVNVSLLINGTEVKNEDVLVRFDSGEYDIIYVNYLLPNDIDFDSIDVVINPIDSDDEILEDNNGKCNLRKKDISIDDIESIKEEKSENTHIIIKIANRGQVELGPTYLSLYKDKGDEKEFIKKENIPSIEINDAVFIEEDISGLEEGDYVYAEIEELNNENIIGNNSNFSIVKLKNNSEKLYSITYHNVPENVQNSNYRGYNPDENFLLSDLTRLGYTFLGWYTQDGTATGKWGTKVTSISSKTNGDLDLYARWQLYPYTITYGNINNADISLNPSTYTIEDEIVLEDAQSSYKIFEGWYTDSSLDEQYKIETIPINSSGDLILYAKWSNELKYQTSDPIIITYKTDEDSEYMTVNKGTRVSITCDTPESIIYYTTDNTNPIVSEDNLYKDTIEINKDLTIKVLSIAIDKDENQLMRPSNIVTYNYHIKEETSEMIENIFDRQYYNDNSDICTDLWMSDIDLEAVETNSPIIYTGKAITPTFRVYDHTALLKQGTDYTVKYSNNTKVGKATITITGKGNYSQSFTTSFNIVPKTEATIDLTKSYIAKKNNAAQTLTLKVTDGKTTLKANKDYIYYVDGVANGKLTEPKEYAISIEGIGNYDFEKEETVKVASNTLLPASKLSISLAYSKTNCAYDNNYEAVSNCPEVTIKEGKNIIFKGSDSNNDFSIEYLNNSDVGTASVIVSVKETGAYAYKYFGSVTKTFKIVGLKLPSNVMQSGLVFKSPTVLYTGNPIELSGLEIWTNSKDESSKLDPCKYDITYEKNIDKGTANIIFTGKEEYTGSTVKKTFKINSKAFDSSIRVEGLKSPFTYLKGGVKPTPIVKDNDKILVLDKDYTLSYKNNTKVGLASLTIKGKGNYSGSITKEFTIKSQNISLLSISVPDKIVSNKANQYKSTPSITDVDGKVLKAGTDYDKNLIYTYVYDTKVIDTTNKANIEVIRQAGTIVNDKDIIPVNTVIKVTARGINNYYNELSTTYRIVQSDISKASVTIPTQIYTGKPITLSKSDIVVKLGKEVLRLNDYDIVSYSNNTNKGSASVTLKGRGLYGGLKTVKFTISNKSMGQTIIFNPNGGTGTMPNLVITKDSKLTANKFKLQGYNS